MARTAAGAALSAEHRRGQLQIRARAVQDYLRLWPLWNGDDKSFEHLVAAALPVVRGYHQLSGSLGTAYYRAFRTAERVGGPPTPRLGVFDEGRVVSSLYVTGQVMTRKALVAGFSPQAAMENALVRTSGAVTRQVLQGGRDATVLSSASDPRAQGFTRVTGGNPCGFCAMIAGRGPVFSEDTADFQAHDHCSCMGEPSYEGSEWPGRAREFRDIYNQHAAGTENPINEMRKALAG